MKADKKILQLFAALWILIFHLWIQFTGSAAESFLVKTGYIGVDVFFFLSAWSLADKEIEYVPFIKNRFIKLYGEFAAFLVCAAVMKNWSIKKILSTALFIDFFTNGGGSFLWFVPAILMFYLVYPLFIKTKARNKTLIVLVLWFVFSILSEKLFGYTKIFIFTSRIPVILAGYELKKRNIPKWLSAALFAAGIVLIYVFGFQRKLNIPFRDFYYVFAVSLMPGFCELSNVFRSGKVLNILASATLEIYAVSMVWGTKITTFIYRTIKTPVLTNLLMLISVIAIAAVISSCIGQIMKITKSLDKK